MLKKLLKNEIYATGRILLPIYGITLILSLVNRILIDINRHNAILNIIGSIMMFSYVTAIIATIIVTFILIILRFYRNLMTDEGYLMFTLPVKPLQLINSKLISSILWFIVSIIVTISSLIILLLNAERAGLIREGWNLIFGTFKEYFGDNYYLLIFEAVLASIISVIQQILLIYASIAVGHLFTGHKVLGAFASYIAISIAAQIFTSIVMVIVAYFPGSTVEELETQFETLPHMVMLLIIGLGVLFSAAYYITTNYIFSKKLNLE